MKREVVYFDKPGKENTDECIKIIENMISDYKDVVVASTTGESGLKIAEKIGKKVNLVVVTHPAGFRKPNDIEMDEDKRKKITELGGKIFIGAILTSSLEKSLIENFQGTYPASIIANTLRLFGQGTKVCCEIVMEACDAGLIEEGKDVLAVAGTGYGWDTVCIIKSTVSRRFMDLKVKEILAKPRNF